MKSITKLVEKLNAFEGNEMFSFVAETTKDSLKKSRITKEPTPEHLTQITVVKASTVVLGKDYEEVINGRLIKEGQEPEFQADASYCVPVAKNKLVYKHKTKDQYYLRVYPNLCHSFKTIVKRFDKDGNEITEEQWKNLEKEYFALKGSNDKQELEDPVIVNNYKLENVKFLKQGEVLIAELSSALIKKLHSGSEE